MTFIQKIIKYGKDVKSSKMLTFIICMGLIPFNIDAINDLHGFSPQNDSNITNSEINQSGTRIKKQIKIYHDEIRKEVRDFPFPPQNYGQYNSPISQKDISQMDFPFLDNGNTILTREIRIKQGRLKGVVRELKNRKLKNVEVYLGIPYAAPPVGPLRFMPPGSPPNWMGIRTFDTFGPVCPQIPPDLNHEPLKTMNAGRFNYLKGLLPFLRNTSEDCLYLNIYAPVQDPRSQIKYPVIVYIHGESFEWNSGNPYDGSILASYGKVVVVTINFRLGILGFLRPGISGHTVSNFGLLDQIAALQWVKDNIGEFGGDASSVTLMGHGTGAACINFLMVSPVSRASDGLFHKAILMSGTALSDWALTDNPFPYMIQVAEALNCPVVDENDELSNCLRRKRLSEIMSVKINVEEFKTPFGPLVDGSVVPNSPEVVMGHYKNLFTRYDMLYGMTEWESYHSLNAVSLAYGMLERERDQLLKNYMRSRYEVLPDLALARTLSQYTDTERTMTRPAAEEHRDLVLDVLSDARITAPMIQMAIYHSSINPKSYLYIFQHKSEFGEFAGSEKSVPGEEIAYVFGAPLANGETSLSHHTYSMKEQLLSEAILTYFTNFAKTSNPNAPQRFEYLTQGPREWKKYDVEWPEFDAQNQSYLALRIPPAVGHRYREKMTNYWNKILPERLSNPPIGITRPKPPKEYQEPVHPPDEDIFGVWSNPPSRKPDPSVNFFNQPKPRPQPTPPWTYGTVIKSPVDHPQKNRHQKPNEREKIGSGQMDHPVDEESAENRKIDTGVASSMALTFFVIIGACFLIINIFAFTLLYYKRKRLKLEESRLNQLSDDLDDGGFREREENRNRGCTGGIYDIVTGSRRGGLKSEEIYEAVRTRSKERSRKCSTSTVDPHTKVREWIQHEIIEKYSPSFLRKMNRQIYQEETRSNSEGFENEIFEPKSSPVKPILKQQSLDTDYSVVGTLPRRAVRKNVQKVSIGIDATPGTRSASVLKQTPIEITKSLDGGLLSAGSSPNSKKESPDESSLRRSRTSVSLQMLPLQNDEEKPVTPLEPTIIKIQHSHSKSDPIENTFQTFGSKKDPNDINVTSRDPEIILKPENLPENTLRNIQKRNFPKVLPDFPTDSSKVAKRLSLPPCSHLVFTPSSEMSNTLNRNKVPPPPPPRISTLDRRHREKQKLQEEVDEEPKILTSSALINFKTPENATSINMISQKRPEPEKPPPDEIPVKEEPKTERKISPSKKISQIPVQKQTPKTIIIASSQNQGGGTLKRQEPNIIIQSTTGPKKSENKSKQVQKPTPHVNLQLEETKPSGSSKIYIRDSKGPSDKSTDKSILLPEKKSSGFEKVISSKPKKKDENKKEEPKKEEPKKEEHKSEPMPKGIIKTPVLDSVDTEESSSSSSLAKDSSSTGTIKKGKKCKDAAT